MSLKDPFVENFNKKSNRTIRFGIALGMIVIALFIIFGILL